MGSQNQFVYSASSIDGHPRSAWMMNNKWQGAIQHGNLVPVEITPVMPGDSFKCKLNAFIRTATQPIFPFMDRVTAHFAAFFVPKRLVWNKTKQFYGENVEGYGIQSEVLEPRDNNQHAVIGKDEVATYPYSIASYLKLVRQNTGSFVSATPINLNVIRSFLQVYNDWFRNENFHSPYLWDHDQTGDGDRYLATKSGSNVSGSNHVPTVCKELDVFTACLPWTQKASGPIALPLGDRAIVKLIPASEAGAPGANATPNLVDINSGEYVRASAESTVHLNASSEFAVPTDEGVGSYFNPNGSLYADLRNATAANVNQLRLAVATQRYFETLARCGSRYREYIKAMFGVEIGDTTAQMAEYLGGFSLDINVDQVVSTAGYASGASNTVGSVGAVSVSGASKDLYKKSFVEPGYVVVVMYTKHNRTYGQGLDAMYTKHEIWDEYNPKFAFMGEQPVKKSRIYFDGSDSADSATFGFNEYGNEYRYKEDMVVGLLAPSNSLSYEFCNLADKYASAPTLSGDFLLEDRNAIARCLAGGASSPDYFVDLYFERKVARPMPLDSVPGLMDHF